MIDDLKQKIKQYEIYNNIVPKKVKKLNKIMKLLKRKAKFQTLEIKSLQE